MNTSEIMLELRHVSKSFVHGGRTLTVLRDIHMQIPSGDACAVIGPSGSGKTTLLGLCAGLDRPTEGDVILNGVHLNDLDEDALARLRNDLTGFVFQTFRLIPSLTALENVMVPAELRGMRQARPRAEALLEQVGLAERTRHYPAQLSGGEQQRVAMARAFINKPRLIFADEPTGSLDEETGNRVLDLLFDLNRAEGATLILVTHDHDLTKRVKRIVTLRNGQLQ